MEKDVSEPNTISANLQITPFLKQLQKASPVVNIPTALNINNYLSIATFIFLFKFLYYFK